MHPLSAVYRCPQYVDLKRDLFYDYVFYHLVAPTFKGTNGTLVCSVSTDLLFVTIIAEFVIRNVGQLCRTITKLVQCPVHIPKA